jgi:AraC-like DNA-binding protein
MMGQFRQYPLPPAVAVAVEEAWSYEPDPADADRPPARLRVLPDGFTDLILRLEVSPTGIAPASAAVCGPTDQYKLAPLPPSSAWVGVRFRFGWVGPALGVSPADLFRRECPADECGPRLAGVFDRLRGCSTVWECVTAVLTAVTGRAVGRSDGRSLDRTRQALRVLGGAEPGGVARLARRLGVSERTLHRDVRAATGLPPTTLARILRFRAAVAGLRGGPPPALSALALACGYADQSHLTREVRALAGLPPTALVAAGRDGEFQV